MLAAEICRLQCISDALNTPVTIMRPIDAQPTEFADRIRTRDETRPTAFCGLCTLKISETSLLMKVIHSFLGNDPTEHHLPSCELTI